MIAVNIYSKFAHSFPNVHRRCQKLQNMPFDPSGFETEQHIRSVKQTCRGYLGVLWSPKIWSRSVHPTLELGSLHLKYLSHVLSDFVLFLCVSEGRAMVEALEIQDGGRSPNF